MKNMTRNQINMALDELRTLRQDKRYSGNLRLHCAMCYSTSSMTEIYDWKQLPHKHTCHTCQKEFGTNEERGIIYDMFSIYGKGKTELPDIRAERWTYINFYDRFLKIKEMGYDVVLEVNCAECIAEKRVPPMIFKFRAAPYMDYTVSYPCIIKNASSFMSDELKREQASVFEPYEYGTALSFLEEVWEHADGWVLTETCRNWLNKFNDSYTYEGRPWSDVFRVLKGILGIDLGE